MQIPIQLAIEKVRVAILLSAIFILTPERPPVTCGVFVRFGPTLEPAAAA